MYNSSYPSLTPEPPAAPKEKSPFLGILSFALFVISILPLCVMVYFIYDLGNQVNFNTAIATQEALQSLGLKMMGAMGCAGILNLGGIGTGVASIFNSNQTGKIFGILGLVLNVLIVLGMCCFLVYSVAQA